MCLGTGLIVVCPVELSVLLKCFANWVDALDGLKFWRDLFWFIVFLWTRFEIIDAASSEAWSIDYRWAENWFVAPVTGLGIPYLLIFIMDFLFLCSIRLYILSLCSSSKNCSNWNWDWVQLYEEVSLISSSSKIVPLSWESSSCPFSSLKSWIDNWGTRDWKKCIFSRIFETLGHEPDLSLECKIISLAFFPLFFE